MEKLTLKQARGMRGLTQAEVASVTGLDLMTISRAERGADSRFSTVQKLAECYRISMDDIVFPDLAETQHLTFTHAFMSDI